MHDLLVPGRLKELIGVFHAKVHVFDDTVVISGANLSESYFVDRKGGHLVSSFVFIPSSIFFQKIGTL